MLDNIITYLYIIVGYLEWLTNALANKDALEMMPEEYIKEARSLPLSVGPLLWNQIEGNSEAF